MIIWHLATTAAIIILIHFKLIGHSINRPNGLLMLRAHLWQIIWRPLHLTLNFLNLQRLDTNPTLVLMNLTLKKRVLPRQNIPRRVPRDIFQLQFEIQDTSAVFQSAN